MNPQIHLMLENMQEHIIFQLQTQHKNIEAAVSKEIKAVLDEFDFEEEVRKHARVAIEGCVESTTREYFSCSGNGAKAIQKHLQDTFDQMAFVRVERD